MNVQGDDDEATSTSNCNGRPVWVGGCVCVCGGGVDRWVESVGT